MTWDFRNLIRRGGGKWPRDWRDQDRRSIRPAKPARKPPPPPPATPAVEEERWITPAWEPPEGSADAWRNAG